VRHVPQLSLIDLLPNNEPIQKDSLLVILKGYFDGGNEADSTQYDVVTLAALSGTTDQWRPFEAVWKTTLEKHKADWLHTTDAVTLNGQFRRDRGWDEGKRDAFILDCVKVVERHIARKKTAKSPGRPGLYPFTVTVVLEDFIKAREISSDVPKDATEICATQAVNRCLEWGKDIAHADFYHLFFDQGEPFRGHISDRKRNPKALKQLPLLDRIMHIGESDCRYVPALQLADLFAWCVSHKNRTPRYGWQTKVLSLPRIDEWLDYKLLVKPLPATANLVKSWNLPRRRPTR